MEIEVADVGEEGVLEIGEVHGLGVLCGAEGRGEEGGGEGDDPEGPFFEDGRGRGWEGCGGGGEARNRG